MPEKAAMQKRIEILTQAVAQGKQLKPEHQAEYENYVKMGLAKSTAGKGAPKQDAQLASLRALEEQIGRVEELYKSGPGATKGAAGLLDYIPTPANRQFDTASAGIGDVAFNAFRTPGAGAQSDAELKARLAATQPSASDYDAAIEEKLHYLRTRLDAAYESLGVKKKGPAPKDSGDDVDEILRRHGVLK